MPTFSYQAKQGPAQVVRGTMEATTQADVVERLLREGLVPVSVVITAADLDGRAHRRHRRGVSGKERRLFVRQLTSLMRANVELVAAMAILREQAGSGSMRELLGDLERAMRDGQSFSDALARRSRLFSPLFLSAIRAGEAVGKLDNILTKLVEFDDQQERLESRLNSALIYPAILLLLGLGCLAFFVGVVVPRMAGLFEQLGGALPWPTQLLLTLSDHLAAAWPWLLGGGLGIAMAWRWLSRRIAVQQAMERLQLVLPVLRDVVEARQVGRFTRTLELLLDSGLPAFQALEIARPTLGSVVREARLRDAQERVQQGAAIAESLRAARCFPPLVTRMIAVGESAGTLSSVLGEIATYYERFMDETLSVLAALLEPAMIVGMGLLVGFCVLAMVLPVFQMTQLVR